MALGEFMKFVSPRSRKRELGLRSRPGSLSVPEDRKEIDMLGGGDDLAIRPFPAC